MMFQVYLLSIGYLLVGAALLLVDEYGGQYLLLLRLRNAVASSKWVPVTLACIGLMLALSKVFWPVDPGPVLLGDFFPVLFLLILTIYHVTKWVSWHTGIGKAGETGTDGGGVGAQQEQVLRKTGSLIELHKRNLGFLILVSSVLHFLFPGAVLL